MYVTMFLYNIMSTAKFALEKEGRRTKKKLRKVEF